MPTLVMHGDDDQIVPIADSALLSAKLLKNGTLKVYEKLPHGMCTTHADVINPDLLAFITSSIRLSAGAAYRTTTVPCSMFIPQANAMSPALAGVNSITTAHSAGALV